MVFFIYLLLTLSPHYFKKLEIIALLDSIFLPFRDFCPLCSAAYNVNV